jgi:hypothetical protein
MKATFESYESYICEGMAKRRVRLHEAKFTFLWHWLGCQIFLGTKYQNRKNRPKRENTYQMAITSTKWPQNIPNGHIICQHLPLQNPTKFTQIGIFGVKIYHLAALGTGQEAHHPTYSVAIGGAGT